MDTRRLIPIGAAVTALLVLAGIASHGRPLTSGVGSGPSASFFDYVATTLILLSIVLLALVVAIARSTPTDFKRPPRRKYQLLSSIVAFASAIALAELFLHSHFRQRLQSLARQQHGQPGQTARAPREPANLRNARVRWDEVGIVLALVAGVGIYFAVKRGRRGALRPLAVRRRAAISRALDESLDDLRSDPNVRRAIIAAYARMERALAVAGLPRAASEAPFEYLERSLLELDAGAGAAHRLTDLFERAKFSQHEPDEGMRDEAIDALVAVRDDLRRPAVEPAAA